MFQYQKNDTYFAQVAHGIEELAAEEFTSLGINELKTEYRGISFKTNKSGLYRINYRSRLASRILAPLASFSCHSEEYLHEKAMEIPWELLFGPDTTFAIFANVANSNIHNSKYASLILKDAIVDRLRDINGSRPNVDRDNPTFMLNLFINRNYAVISFDTSGGALHKRGYRKRMAAAPMQETLAAAIVDLIEWDGKTPLIDPMCGTGTLLSEAAIKEFKIPPGSWRENWGFKQLPDFNEALWDREKKLADDEQKVIPPRLISGSDANMETVKSARINLESIAEGGKIEITKSDFFKNPPMENVVLIFNPPWGLRLGEEDKMKDFYRDIGDFLKHNCKGSTAYIFVGKRELIKSLGLRTTWKKPLPAANLDGRLIKLDLY
jgi:23S rRNA (guanine2445-N2)-methyltransferase